MNGSILSANFSHHDLIHVIKNFETSLSKRDALPNLRELLNDWLEQFEQSWCNAEELDAIYILVVDDLAKFVYDPTIHHKQHPKSPSWCIALVDLLQYAFKFKEWIHAMKQTCADFEHETT
jgi:hypothetical protein